MADSLITFFLNKSYDLLQEERKISASAQKQLESLINEAKHMSIFLRKADSMDIIDEARRECLKQVREILFDAEDSIEKYVLREGLLRRRPSLKKMLVPFKSLRNKHRIYANAEDLKSKSADAMDNLQKYTVDFRQGSSSKTQNDTRADLEDASDRILRRCKGLPLAILATCKLFRNNNQPSIRGAPYAVQWTDLSGRLGEESYVRGTKFIMWNF